MVAQAVLRGNITVKGESPVSVFDFAGTNGRVQGIAIGDLDIHLGTYSDEDAVAAASLLIAALETVRQDAISRIQACTLAAEMADENMARALAGDR